MTTFGVGDTFDLGSVKVAVRQGRKSRNDLVVAMRCPDMVPVPMALVALLLDFLYDNEERVYPLRDGFEGGERFLREVVAKSVVYGWTRAHTGVTRERDAAISGRVRALR